jgi:hypothetical protein
MMPTQTVEIETSSGIIGIWDPSLCQPSSATGEQLTAELKVRAKAGDIFFVDAEDPVSYRISLHIDEGPPQDVVDAFRVRGSYRLRVMSGTLRLGPIPAAKSPTEIKIPAGDYVLTALAAQFDPVRYTLEVKKLIGESDFKYRLVIERYGMLGCLAWVLAAILLAAPGTRVYWKFLSPCSSSRG